MVCRSPMVSGRGEHQFLCHIRLRVTMRFESIRYAKKDSFLQSLELVGSQSVH